MLPHFVYGPSFLMWPFRYKAFFLKVLHVLAISLTPCSNPGLHTLDLGPWKGSGQREHRPQAGRAREYGEASGKRRDKQTRDGEKRERICNEVKDTHHEQQHLCWSSGAQLPLYGGPRPLRTPQGVLDPPHGLSDTLTVKVSAPELCGIAMNPAKAEIP